MAETILVIENIDSERRDTENLLKIHDYRTIGVQSIEKAKEVLENVEVDLILIGTIPDGNGLLEFTRSVREESAYIPIITFSNKDMSEIKKFADCIDDHLPKPITNELFNNKIRLMLRIGRLEKKLCMHEGLLEKKVAEHGKKIMRSRSEAKKASALNEVINIINSDININGVIQATSREIKKFIQFEKLSITLKKPYKEKLAVYIQDEKNSEEIILRHIYLSAINGPGRVLNTRQIMIQHDIWRDTNLHLEFEQILSSDIRSAVIFPLISKGKLIGTLNIGNKSAKFYKKSDIKIIYKIINQISIAIENASLYSEVKELSQQLQRTVNERNAEIDKKYYQLSLLNKVGQTMQGTGDLDRLLHLILTCVTAGGAIGFNRAMLFRVNYEKEYLEGVMGVGPSSWEEAWQIWDRLSKENWKLDDFLRHYDQSPTQSTYLDEIARSIKISLNNRSDFIVMSVIEKRPFLITDAMNDRRLNQIIKDKLMVNELVIVPLLAREKALGVVIADNLFSGRKIDDDSMQLLIMFANQAGLALERAAANEKLTIKISELKQAYEELKETQSKLMRTERLATIGKMAAHVAHEIRNPLATIGGFAHAMIKFPHDQERIRRNANIICEEVYRLERILQNVLDFTKPASPVFELGNIHQVINDTILLFQKDIESNNIIIRKNLKTDIPQLLIDSQQIKQAFINIFKNAIYSIGSAKLNQNNGIENYIEVNTNCDEKFIRVIISDTGNGMTPTVMENLFNPFFSTKPGGSGLGLAVTHKIVEDHGGYIDVKSKVGKGSEFIINLPLRTEKNN